MDSDQELAKCEFCGDEIDGHKAKDHVGYPVFCTKDCADLFYEEMPKDPVELH